MDSFFFWLSKTGWALASPGGLLVLAVVSIWLLLKMRALVAARLLALLLALSLTVIALFPVGEWLLYPLETRFAHNPDLPHAVDGIIVLGGSIDSFKSASWNQVEIRSTAEREFNFLMLARRYPRAKLIFTGGSGSLVSQDYKEAEWAKKLFAQQGMDINNVIFEGHARNTYENALHTKQLVQPSPGENWLLITTAFHMPRSVGVFCKAGFPVIAYPVDHWTLPNNLLRIEWNFTAHFYDFNIALQEWVGLFVYRLTGKTTDLLPSGC
ncbi:MAG TPA: YdcF family protein [Gammaproteobacteria bacterium]